MHFTIDRSHICQVTTKESISCFKGRKSVTDEELIKILKGEDKWESISSDDHPEFKKLRNLLELEGFIKTERNWWNGDYVIKEFTLNGAIFKKNEQFACGAALGYTLDRKIKEQNENSRNVGS